MNSINITNFDNMIKKLKPKKAAGIDRIPLYIIKGCSEWLKQLCYLIYKYLSNGLENSFSYTYF